MNKKRKQEKKVVNEKGKKLRYCYEFWWRSDYDIRMTWPL